MIGKIINYRYEVLEKVGDGPLFAVYRARDKVLNRLVALKTPNREVSEMPGINEAFVTAYRNMTSFSHPNIARVLDADCVDGECFIACEFARGINVKERVRRAGPIAAPLAVEIMRPVLSTLQAAHNSGIVHGDLAPQDVVVSPDGEVKVTDFGLSGVLAEHVNLADKYMMRSIRYQAPEISEGAAPSVASDLYSVGVMLYEMLTGQLPFDGATAVAVAMKKVKESPVNPRAINTAVPKSLADICMKALEPNPRDRHQSAAEMLAEFESLSVALRMGLPVNTSVSQQPVKVAVPVEEIEEPQEKSFWSTFMLLLLVFVGVCAAVTLGVYMLQRQPVKYTVPPIIGKTWDEAQAVARDAKITLVDDGTAFSSAYPAGQICSVVPPPGQLVSPDTPVKVKISSGPSRVGVPYVVNKSEPDATSAIVQAGFMIGRIKQANSDTVPVNSVISQDPQGGSRRSPGTSVDLVVSLGPKEETELPPADTGGSGSNADASQSEPKTYNVHIDVPSNAPGPQDVKVIVEDSQGESTPFAETRDPGESFDVPITASGSEVTVKVYIGDQLVRERTYKH